MELMTHMDLFSGIGGFAAAAEAVWGLEYLNVGHSEISPHGCFVYHNRFPRSFCYGKIQNTIAFPPGIARLITGGFPCQPVSHAGNRGGKEDVRWLWPQMFKVLRRCRPTYTVAENVYGLVSHKGGYLLDEIYADLESIGYEVLPPLTLPACSVGAPHLRRRVWIVAYCHDGLDTKPSEEVRAAWDAAITCDDAITNSYRPGFPRTPAGSQEPNTGLRRDAAHPTGVRRQRVARKTQGRRQEEAESCPDSEMDADPYVDLLEESEYIKSELRDLSDGRWRAEPNVGRVAHGVPLRVDRIIGLGNAIVPQVAATIFHTIREVDKKLNPV